MGWFRRSQRLTTVTVKKKGPWTVCPSCKAHIYNQQWNDNLKICPKCTFHDKITCDDRVKLLIDDGTFRQLDSDITAADPLGFSDAKGTHVDKIESTRTKTSLNESVLTGTGEIHGTPVVIAVMDFRFMGGSLGGSTGEKIFLASDYALRHRVPYIIFSASGGARMQEGMVSLMQMAKTCAGIARLHKAGVPYISVLTHPTTGGVSASFAMVGDINLAEPGVLIGFAGRRVIEQTIKQELPKDFQTAEYLLEHGFVDAIVDRREMKDFLRRVLRYWRKK